MTFTNFFGVNVDEVQVEEMRKRTDEVGCLSFLNTRNQGIEKKRNKESGSKRKVKAKGNPIVARFRDKDCHQQKEGFRKQNP